MPCWWRSRETNVQVLDQFKKDCPHCGRETFWKRFKVIENEKCYSLIPCGNTDKGEYIQCNVCGAQYVFKAGQKSGCCD